MPLQVNSRLGPYEIKSPLGAGGMGEVYRARDSRLNRDVAIKGRRFRRRRCGDATSGFWSPDRKTVAYASDVNSTRQVFLKLLNSPVATQLTHEKTDIFPIGWSDDGSHIVAFESGEGYEGKFYSLATVGGEPEFLIDGSGFAFALSADGKALAEYGSMKGGLLGVNISDPLGSPLFPTIPHPVWRRPDVEDCSHQRHSYSSRFAIWDVQSAKLVARRKMDCL